MQVTSYEQMDAIIEYGCYEIGIKEPIICKSQNKIISLTLELNKEDQEKHLKTSYTLEELQDLESKLVLITGSNDENRKKVDLFVNVSFLDWYNNMKIVENGNENYFGCTLFF